MKKRLDEVDPEWLLLGGITPKGLFRLYSQEQRFKLEPDWTAIYFAPPTARAPRNAKAVADAAASEAVSAAGGAPPTAAAPATDGPEAAAP